MEVPKSTFSAFVRAFGGGWFTLMSGGLGVPLTIWTIIVTNDFAKAILAITAAVCFVLASYFVWREERKKVIELSELMNKRNERGKVAEIFGAAYLNIGELVGNAPAVDDGGIWDTSVTVALDKLECDLNGLLPQAKVIAILMVELNVLTPGKMNNVPPHLKNFVHFIRSLDKIREAINEFST